MNTADSPAAIQLRGVRVHNLQNIDLDLPLGQFFVVTGLSGSGKSSLAFDTLFAEGQRRYLESLSTYTRQFLDRIEQPDADRIDHIPPAIAIRQKSSLFSRRSTLGTATELLDYLRLLYVRIGRIVCPTCRREVRSDSPVTVSARLQELPPGTRFQICFPLTTLLPDEDPAPPRATRTAQLPLIPEDDIADLLQNLQEAGFTRLIWNDQTINLTDSAARTAPGGGDTAEQSQALNAPAPLVVVDRLTAGTVTPERLADSLELAFARGDESCVILIDSTKPAAATASSPTSGATTDRSPDSAPPALERIVDGRAWHMETFSQRLVCGGCGEEFLPPEPRLLSFNSPLGACPTCHGFGSVPVISWDKIVPDPGKTLRDGAIAPWTTPAYRHELDELLALAPHVNLPVDIPFRDLTEPQRQLVLEGVPKRKFGGLRGFFAWLDRHKYKPGVGVFLSRWRAYGTCPDCHGQRLQPQALAIQIQGKNIAEFCAQTVAEALDFCTEVGSAARTNDALPTAESRPRETVRTADPTGAGPSTPAHGPLAVILPQITARLHYLQQIGLSYLTLDRPMHTLSGGEAQRAMLTSALGSNLVNMLYVLDEPSIGLHPRDTERLLGALRRLRDVGNTVVVVEHEEQIMRAAGELIDIGPGAGRNGGHVVYQGPPADIAAVTGSPTADYLSGRRRAQPTSTPRTPRPVSLRLAGARLHNLQNLSVEFPLGVLCVVTGVSGSGKSSLVQDTLYPAVARALDPAANVPAPGPFDQLLGVEDIDEVLLVDQSPIGRTPRSNPATYLKIFDQIRALFAATAEAKVRKFTAGHFSFNSAAGGRCPTCRGNGSIAIDLQFLPDLTMTCPDCHGTRFQRQILDVKYRGLNIAEVLGLTVADAFPFFRGQSQLQRRLKFLKDVGLDYITLGQPADTLSGGESQRLKLAAFLARGSRQHTLFVLDEPTTGLHPADVAQLLDCFQILLQGGHSLIVVEHNLDILRCADWLIDLGPEAGQAGGRLVATGTPADIAHTPESITGRYLKSEGGL